MVHGGSPHQAPAALTALAEAVAGLAVAPVTDELVELMSVRDRFETKVVEALAGFFASGGHAVDGYRSPISWLRAHVPVTGRDASLLVAWAKRVPDWPVLAKLWFDGDLNRAQYAAVCARLQNPRLIELYADHDAEVSPLLVGLSVKDTTTAIDQWAQMAESVLAPDPHDQQVPEPGDPLPVDGELTVARYGDGDERGMLRGDLDADTMTITQKALTAAMPKLVEGDTRSHAQRQAEAWVRICEFYLDHADCHGGRGAAARMIVVTELADLYRTALWGLGIHDADQLDAFLAVNPVSVVEEGWLRDALAHATGQMRTTDGWPLNPGAVTSLFGKDSTLERVMLADGQVLDHGRTTRLFTGHLREVLLARDQGCRFPSPTGEPCGAPVAWLHGHHIHLWEDGGPTSLLNGLLLCPTHHALVHTEGWTLTVDPDGTVTIEKPDGTTLTSPPPRAHRPPRLPLRHPKIDALQKPPPASAAPANEPSAPERCDRRSRPEPDGASERAGRSATSGPAGAPDQLHGRERPEPVDAPDGADETERPEPGNASEHHEGTDDVDGPGRTIACSTVETITIRLDRPADLRPTEEPESTDSAGPDDAAPDASRSLAVDTALAEIEEAAGSPPALLGLAEAGEVPDGGRNSREPAEADGPGADPVDVGDLPPELVRPDELPIERRRPTGDVLRRSATHRSGRRRYPDLVVTMPDGEELWLRLTTAA